jgi:exopolysaccharide biosynthesis polyprenyl glycosylphosphotransferase
MDKPQNRAEASEPGHDGGMRLRNTSLILPSILLVTDLLVLECAFLCVYWVRFLSTWFPVSKGVPDLGVYLVGSLAMLLLFAVILYANSMYDLRRRPGIADDLTGLLRSVLIATVLLAAVAFFYRGYSFSRTFVAGFVVAAYVFLLSGRVFARYLHLVARSMGVGLERVLLVGRGSTQQEVLRRVAERPGLGFAVLGEALRPGETPAALPVLGTVEELPDIVQRHQIDVVLVTLPLSQLEQWMPMLELLADSQVRVQLVPDLDAMRASNLRILNIEGLPLLEMRQVAITGIHRVFKRAFDIIVSVLALVVLSPVLLLIAVLVKLTSRGPVLYRQQRLGRDGRRFDMLKFRTMRQDAESHTGPVFARAGDPRRTPLGGLLRTFSLDELPQFFNVLKGDMSLVGPRPERPVFVEEFRGSIPRYFERHKVRSGITGWAQVNGLRGDTPLEERTRYDIYYVENWSLAFDIKILFLTLRSVLTRDNAY